MYSCLSCRSLNGQLLHSGYQIAIRDCCRYLIHDNRRAIFHTFIRWAWYMMKNRALLLWITPLADAWYLDIASVYTLLFTYTMYYIVISFFRNTAYLPVGVFSAGACIWRTGGRWDVEVDCLTGENPSSTNLVIEAICLTNMSNVDYMSSVVFWPCSHPLIRTILVVG